MEFPSKKQILPTFYSAMTNASTALEPHHSLSEERLKKAAALAAELDAELSNLALEPISMDDIVQECKIVRAARQQQRFSQQTQPRDDRRP